MTGTILISPCAARGTYIHLRMNPKFWLTTMFLISRIGVLDANSRCHVTESSIGGMYLRGHVFKVHRDELPEECFFLCDEEVTCQSYNVVIGQNICELNNRTKEARPEDFIPDQRRFYMKRSRNRGTLNVPSTTFCICVSGQTYFFNFPFTITENSNFRETKIVDTDIFLWRAFWWFNFGDCFIVDKAF